MKEVREKIELYKRQLNLNIVQDIEKEINNKPITLP
jgi:hypothetical protein